MHTKITCQFDSLQNMINKNLKKCHKKNFFKKYSLKAQAFFKTRNFFVHGTAKSPNVNSTIYWIQVPSSQKEEPRKWPKLYKGKDKPKNMSFWWDMQDQYNQELEDLEDED